MYSDGTRETWPFECLHCRHIWAEVYTLRQITDNRGNITDVWLLDDVPVQPPLVGARCPTCQGTCVTAFPKGYLDRRPDLLSREPPAHVRPDFVHPETLGPGMTCPECPGSAMPVAEPFRAPGPETVRRHTRTVYVVVIALAAFLVAAYEFYAIVLTKAQLH